MPPPPDLAAHPGLAAVERLRRVREALVAGEVPDPDDGRWLAAGLERYEDQAPAGARLDEVLRLVPGPGQPPWWRVARVGARDGLIRELAGTFTGPAWSRAQAVADALRRYQTTGWWHDQKRGEPCTSDPRRKMMFAIFSADEDPPTGPRRVYDIITA